MCTLYRCKSAMVHDLPSHPIVLILISIVVFLDNSQLRISHLCCPKSSWRFPSRTRLFVELDLLRSGSMIRTWLEQSTNHPNQRILLWISLCFHQ
ncbi:hypothetical protein Lalb_Chr09g0335491 [Lupinus albus]|uniref:Uncharacterized protein n=1 Tax=Lupinus albus TaxID=3870 RepID=A0A6A4Q2D3_LUPAL|nr:hypothetical protein Lalb_Chr09g0335491 [Lupinus albus]